MNVERRLTELIGEPGRRLHTARSRNDQVATDLRLYARARGARAGRRRSTRRALALCRRAREHAATLLPGYTHLQRAQVVTLGHHLLAYAEMLGRDRGRLRRRRAARRANRRSGRARWRRPGCPSIARRTAARARLRGGPTHNSLDAVSDRDFAAEIAFACALLGVHLSRLGEELVLWSTTEFGFVRLGEGYCSGSSLMPQKRNPDIAELLRGKPARADRRRGRAADDQQGADAGVQQGPAGDAGAALRRRSRPRGWLLARAAGADRGAGVRRRAHAAAAAQDPGAGRDRSGRGAGARRHAVPHARTRWSGSWCATPRRRRFRCAICRPRICARSTPALTPADPAGAGPGARGRGAQRCIGGPAPAAVRARGRAPRGRAARARTRTVAARAIACAARAPCRFARALPAAPSCLALRPRRLSTMATLIRRNPGRSCAIERVTSGIPFA